MNTNTTDDSTASPTVLTVRVDSPENAFDRLGERFGALDRDETPAPLHEVVLQREADLARLINPRTMALLRTIARECPSSIRETARLVERDVRQVHSELGDLERMGIVRFETDGAAKRPVVPYDEIDVRLPVTDDADDTEGRPTAPA